MGRKEGKERSRGAAAVEFALVLPVLLALVLGGIDYSYYFFVDHIVTASVCEGARAGVIQDTDAAATSVASSTTRSFLDRAGLDPARATIDVTVDAGSLRVSVAYTTGSLTGFTGHYLVPAFARAVSEMRR